MNFDLGSQINPTLVIFIPDLTKWQINLCFRMLLTGNLDNLTSNDIKHLKQAWKLLEIDYATIRLGKLVWIELNDFE